ncbi:HTH domain-containing protein [Candidatus Poribacteria bacterium]|nr:HTH domain-containing protein [Candidatus Poribacteria bacterium]
MAKSEKIFEMLEYISEYPNLTPRDLARLCEVSERAIYRYLNTLSKVGISVQFEDGGYKLQGGYRDIFKKPDPEGLEALKILLSAGMEVCNDQHILEHGKSFLKIIDSNLPTKRQRNQNEIEIVPEEIRAKNRGGTITVGHSSQPSIINPILTSETISVNLMNLIYSSLVKFDNLQQPIPDIARNWEISKDGLVWTFYIREDVNFHDGHPLTAHDVEFTYKSIIDPKNGSPRAKRYELIEKMETEGDYIFRIYLKHPFAPFICRMGWAIAPRHLMENINLQKTKLNKKPVGSGPFKLEEWKDDNTIVLDANRKYFRKDRPILDRLVFKSYPDRESALQAMAQGKMDIAFDLAASDLLFASENATFRIYSAYNGACYTILFNLEDPVFKDIRVRKALDYAIDKESIIDTQLKGHGTICTGPFSIDSWAYNPDVKPTPYNIEKAQELLAESGWVDTDGDGLVDKDKNPLVIKLSILNISDVMERIAKSIKVQLMKIGIKVELDRIDDSKIYETNFHAMLILNGAGPDPESALRSWNFNGENSALGNYKNSFIDNLMKLGKTISDIKSRKSIYHKIHEMMHDDCSAIFIASAFDYIGSTYRFRIDKFPSMMQFLTSMKDWQIVTRKNSGKSNEDQGNVDVLARTVG